MSKVADTLILSQIPLSEILAGLREIVREEISTKQKSDAEDQLLSPADTCKIFQPHISKVTLSKWTKDGYLKEHRIGGRVYYKTIEVIEAAKHLKKYKKPVVAG